MKCYKCNRNIETHPECEGLLVPLKDLVNSDYACKTWGESQVSRRARKLIKVGFDSRVRLCGRCFWGLKLNDIL